jgi:hypothetical protein
MSAATAARKPRTATPKPAAEATIPLEDLSITWRPVPFFHDGNDPDVLTLTGKDLPIALHVLSIVSPRGNWSKLGDPEDIALETAGLADLVEALSNAENFDVNMNAVLWSVSRRIRELAARGSAVHSAPDIAPTVTITRKPATASASSSAEPDAARKVAAYDATQRIVDAVKKAGKGKVA